LPDSGGKSVIGFCQASSNFVPVKILLYCHWGR